MFDRKSLGVVRLKNLRLLPALNKIKRSIDLHFCKRIMICENAPATLALEHGFLLRQRDNRALGYPDDHLRAAANVPLWQTLLDVN
jgi:hypothetical protein